MRWQLVEFAIPATLVLVKYFRKAQHIRNSGVFDTGTLGKKWMVVKKNKSPPAACYYRLTIFRRSKKKVGSELNGKLTEVLDIGWQGVKCSVWMKGL